VFVQISDENVHHVREILDELFGIKNMCCIIPFVKTGSKGGELLDTVNDYLIWYGKDKKKIKYRQLFFSKILGGEKAASYTWIESPNGRERRRMTADELEKKEVPQGWKLFSAQNMTSQSGGSNSRFPVKFGGRVFIPQKNFWKTNEEGMQKLIAANRLIIAGNSLNYVRYQDDFPFIPINNIWTDTAIAGFSGEDKVYVVQTAKRVIQRCVLMTTDPGDIVLDPTCGSGTMAYIAEQWGRRWITCDTSRVALSLAKQRLMTASYEYYDLAHPEEGIGSGFRYDTVPHIMLKSIANDEPPEQETLYDQPIVDKSKLRVTGPFTVEAVPAPVVKALGELPQDPVTDHSIARSGETLRQSDWRDELQRTGIRGKSGQYILFSRLEPMPGTRYIHATGEIRPNDKGSGRVSDPTAPYGQRVVVSFGPDHAPLEQRQVALAIEEAQTLVPKPKVVVFAAFQFDPEAAKDIDETNWPGVTLLKAQMNPDLMTEDLKRARSSNESFWLIGQPDVRLQQIKKGDDKGKWQVTVEGFDYYNTKTGEIESGSAERIAIWFLDTDYDGRSLFPRQVFFPMSDEDQGWSKLAKNLRAEIDEDLIEAYRGNISLPFEPGTYKRIAVKIVDDRGIESLKVIKVE